MAVRNARRCSWQVWDPWQICKQIALLQVAFYIGLYLLEILLAGVISSLGLCNRIDLHCVYPVMLLDQPDCLKTNTLSSGCFSLQLEIISCMKVHVCSKFGLDG